MSEQLLGRDFAVIGEPQQHEDWTTTEGGFLRFYGPPPTDAAALWGGVNATQTDRPWNMRATADVGDPNPQHGELPHYPLLLVAGVALYLVSKVWR